MVTRRLGDSRKYKNVKAFRLILVLVLDRIVTGYTLPAYIEETEDVL